MVYPRFQTHQYIGEVLFTTYRSWVCVATICSQEELQTSAPPADCAQQLAQRFPQQHDVLQGPNVEMLRKAVPYHLMVKDGGSFLHLFVGISSMGNLTVPEVVLPCCW